MEEPARGCQKILENGIDNQGLEMMPTKQYFSLWMK